MCMLAGHVIASDLLGFFNRRIIYISMLSCIRAKIVHDFESEKSRSRESVVSNIQVYGHDFIFPIFLDKITFIDIRLD